MIDIENNNVFSENINTNDDNNVKVKTKAILVGIVRESIQNTDIMLDELERLLETAGGEVFSRITQARESPDARTYIGSGKIIEIGNICKINNVNLIVFDDELTPSQIKNIENDIGSEVRVIDRSMLILDIFALHAVSGEGKLQVELAQLQYTAPRLTGKGLAMSRQQGGNIAMRGPGETKLETDRRHIRRRMNALRQQLDELEKSRSVMHTRREKSGIKQAAIAGYTNAGKSTLLNYLTNADILAEDKLFATLDPTTRKYKLPCGEEILLTDTVGFIRNLPHHLIEAFKSTLDEVKYADVILVIIDASDPDYLDQTAVSQSLLSELGINDKPILYVFNKCDKPAFEIPVLSNINSDDQLYISALTGQGIDKLVDRLQSIFTEGKKTINLRIPNSEQKIINTIYKNSTVLCIDYGSEHVDITAIADIKARGLLADYII